MYKTFHFDQIKGYQLNPQRLIWLLIQNLNLQGRQLFHFLNAFQKWYILTEFLIIFMLFIFFNKNKASDQTASTGVRTQTYLQVLHIITRGCSANWTIPACQNLSFLRKVCKIWNETQLVSFSLLNGFALKKGPPLYVKFVIFANFSYGKEFHF